MLKPEYPTSLCFLVGEKHPCLQASEAPRGERERLERLERRAAETRRRWTQSGEPRLPDE